MKIVRLCLLIFSAMLVLSGCADRTDNVKYLLPELDQLPEGWTMESGPEIYCGDSLYSYIDGGADLFHEYGFECAATCSYRDPEGNTLIVDAFEMESPLAAYGILSCQKNYDDPGTMFGYSGSVSPYMHIFCKGKYYLKVQSFGDDKSNYSSRRKLAEVIDQAISSERKAEIDSSLSLIAADSLLPKSRMIAFGPLALNTRNYISDDNLFELGKDRFAVCGKFVDGKDTLDVIVTRYENELEASRKAADVINQSRTEISEEVHYNYIFVILGKYGDFYVRKIREKIVGK